MTVWLDRRGARLAVLGVLAALALAGCGRKSALELPPSASIAQPGQPAPAPAPSLGEPGPEGMFRRPGAAPAPPPAPPPTADKRTFPLDPLLN